MMIVHDPRMVKVGYSKLLGEQGEKTSTIAKEFNSIAAINGGGFTDKAQNSSAQWTGTGALPIGIVMADSKVIYPKEITEPAKKIPGDLVGITENGVLIIGRYSLNDLKKNKVADAMTFGPILILNGVIQNRDSNGNNIDNQGPAPRTAIGQRKEDGAILLLVIDGRQGLQAGATIKDVQNIMAQEKAFNAINLDGGASTTMYYDGQILNNPSDKFGERPIPTIFYVKR
jgi:exopolysaccharide biosynthesis protein